MSKHRPLLALFVLAFAFLCLSLGALSCGKDSKKVTAPTPTTHNFPAMTPGIWRVTITATAVSGGSECSSFNSSSVDTIDDIEGFFPDCRWNVTGSRFTQACADTIVYDCTMIESYSGSGSFTSTTFTAVYNITLAGTCMANCVIRFNLSGRRLGDLEPARLRPAAHVATPWWRGSRR
jgi:hypothetical protein